MEEYVRNKRSRDTYLFEGEPLFDNKKGFYSISQTAEILKIPRQKVYYAIRKGELNFDRKGVAYVIHIKDINAFKKSKSSK